MTEDVEACGNSMGRGWGSARCAVWDPDGLGGWMGAERGAALLGLRDVFGTPEGYLSRRSSMISSVFLLALMPCSFATFWSWTRVRPLRVEASIVADEY